MAISLRCSDCSNWPSASMRCLVLDEAHATGVLGEQGRGLTELLLGESAPTERLIKIGTLSKALGSQGGFVCGSRRLDRMVGQSCATLHLFNGIGTRQRRRRRQGHRDREERAGSPATFTDNRQASSQRFGEARLHLRCVALSDCAGYHWRTRRSMRLSKALEEDGLLVPAIRPPSVPPGTSRLRS